MKEYNQFYIDGAWVDPLSYTPFELVNPATEEVFGTVALGSVADVEAAVAAAKRALPAFAAQTKDERIALLERIIDAYVARQDDLMAALTLEMGAPVRLTQQTGAGLAALKQAVETLRDYDFEEDMGTYILQREAIGIAGLITPWNWPVQLICNKLASAFAAGCPVVLKPSEFTPVSALVFAEIIDAADVPKGAFNLVNGDGPTVGNAISSHHDIGVVSFTGSTRAGILVAEAAAPSVKRVTQELGGKSANLILPDGDVAAAANYNVTRGYSNSGQSCHSPTRILVPEDKLEDLITHLQASVAAHIRVGDPTDPETTHGPVVNRAQFDRIQAYIQSAIDEGARLITGGPGRPDGLNRGFFIQPTIFVVTPDMTIAREEIFGMVTSVMTYKTVDEAIALANDTEYGLGAYVFGEDRETALNVCRQMQAGRVFYNGCAASTVAPMGGYKKSGNGREMGVYGMEEYLETKAILGF